MKALDTDSASPILSSLYSKLIDPRTWKYFGMVDSMSAAQVVEDRYGAGAWWGLLQMPFGDNNPRSVNWPVIPLQFSKQYFAMMQVSHLNLTPQNGVTCQAEMIMPALPSLLSWKLVLCKDSASGFLTQCATDMAKSTKLVALSVCCLLLVHLFSHSPVSLLLYVYLLCNELHVSD